MQRGESIQETEEAAEAAVEAVEAEEVVVLSGLRARGRGGGAEWVVMDRRNRPLRSWSSQPVDAPTWRTATTRMRLIPSPYTL